MGQKHLLIKHVIRKNIRSNLFSVLLSSCTFYIGRDLIKITFLTDK